MKAGIDKCFDVIETADGLKPNESKPNPKLYLNALGELQNFLPDIQASDCIVTEDTPAGVESANKANYFVIGITNTVKDPKKLWEAGAHLVVNKTTPKLYFNLLKAKEKPSSKADLVQLVDDYSILPDVIDIGGFKDNLYVRKSDFLSNLHEQKKAYLNLRQDFVLSCPPALGLPPLHR